MWIPESEEEIEVAVLNRSLSESATFDAKKQIPPKNVDTAVDVSALANSSGGVLLYGLDEDESGCPCVPNPIVLAGQRERVEQIIRTSIDEVPSIKILPAIPTRADPTLGYMVVLVPPSARAPHMVIVKGERRFYGRGETGNYILNQSEVARLYERRQRSSQSGIWPFLQEYVSNPPIVVNPGFSQLHVALKPVLSDDGLLQRAVIPGQTVSGTLSTLVREVLDDHSYNFELIEPIFNIPVQGWKQYAEYYVGKMGLSDPSDAVPDVYVLQCVVHLDGSAYLFCARAAETQQKRKLFFKSSVLEKVSRFLALLNKVYENASYFGMVDVAVQITNLNGCVSYESPNVYLRPQLYDGGDYKKKPFNLSLKLR